MPRKSKETVEELEDKKVVKKITNTVKKSVTAKKATTKKSVSTKKASVKKSSPKNSTSKTKKTKTAKKTTSKKVVSKNASAVPKKPVTVEYYDLPQKYNKTVIKLLAQTPKTLFVYWEISDDDIEKFKKQYGENFFETTKPVLIVHNDTLNYSFEVDINDFANSWYIHVNDSKSDYRIELGRRRIDSLSNNSNSSEPNYIYVISSNEIESPNDHILFDKNQKMVYFRNVKTGKETAKPFATLSFIRNMGKIYEIYDLYKKLYNGKENLEDLTNPSSQSSSSFK